MFEFNNLEDIFNEYFNHKDIYVNLKITKEQAKFGSSMPIKISRKIINKDNSYVIKKTVETINVPKNVKDNTVIKLTGKGNQYSTCKENGDLYVEIKIFGTK